jgi:hypothetical protein
MGGKQQEPISGSEDSTSARQKPKFSVGNPNFVSKLLFLFIDPLIKYAHSTTLEADNLYQPALVHTDRVHGVFEKAWREQLKSGHPDIRKAVVANSLGGLIFTGFLYCISLASQLVGPMMLQRIVSGLQCWVSQGGQKGGVCPTQQDLY